VLGLVAPGAATLEATAGTLNACLPHTVLPHRTARPL